MTTLAPTARPAPARRRVAPSLLAGLTLLGIAMTATAAAAPEIASGTGVGDHPDYAVIAGTGAVAIALSSLFLAFAARVIGLGAAWFALAAVANALLLVSRLVLSPVAFYQTTFVEGWILDVRWPGLLATLAAALFLLSAVGVAVAYGWVRGWASGVLDRAGEPLPRSEPGMTLLLVAVVLGIPLLLLATPVLVGYGLVVTTATGGAAILLFLMSWATGAGAAWRAAQRSVSLRDTAVLTTAFWLVLSLLLVYHVVWLVLMTGLVSLWPLKTVAPSGK